MSSLCPLASFICCQTERSIKYYQTPYITTARKDQVTSQLRRRNENNKTAANETVRTRWPTSVTPIWRTVNFRCLYRAPISQKLDFRTTVVGTQLSTDPVGNKIAPTSPKNDQLTTKYSTTPDRQHTHSKTSTGCRPIAHGHWLTGSVGRFAVQWRRATIFIG